MRKNTILALALGAALAAFGTLRAQDSRLAGPEETAGTCHLAHAKGGAVEVPCHDRAKMSELQGLDGKSTAKVTIEWPKAEEVLEKGEGLIKYKLEDYTIGKDDKGNFQHCHVILDNKPYEADYDHTTTLEKANGGKPLDEGAHILTIFPARNFHLSVKNPGACAQVRFWVKAIRTGEGVEPEKSPQLIYSRPKGTYDSAKGEAKELLLDFYLRNVTLGKGRFVECTVADEGGKTLETHKIEEWWPVMILKDAKPGKYKVTLALEGAAPGHDQEFDARFNKVTREITIK
jgi:hypothetical protein